MIENTDLNDLGISTSEYSYRIVSLQERLKFKIFH